MVNKSLTKNRRPLADVLILYSAIYICPVAHKYKLCLFLPGNHLFHYFQPNLSLKPRLAPSHSRMRNVQTTCGLRNSKVDDLLGGKRQCVDVWVLSPPPWLTLGPRLVRAWLETQSLRRICAQPPAPSTPCFSGGRYVCWGRQESLGCPTSFYPPHAAPAQVQRSGRIASALVRAAQIKRGNSRCHTSYVMGVDW